MNEPVAQKYLGDWMRKTGFCDCKLQRERGGKRERERKRKNKEIGVDFLTSKIIGCYKNELYWTKQDEN